MPALNAMVCLFPFEFGHEHGERGIHIHDRCAARGADTGGVAGEVVFTFPADSSPPMTTPMSAMHDHRKPDQNRKEQQQRQDVGEPIGHHIDAVSSPAYVDIHIPHTGRRSRPGPVEESYVISGCRHRRIRRCEIQRAYP
jgi:hypothetical protein